MDGTTFVKEVRNIPDVEPDDNVFQSIWAEYERVILRSLVTSFGLDILIKDQYGGDVDTIYNVRRIGEGLGKDPQMAYKNKQNAEDYKNRGEYDRHEYHEKNPYYKQKTTEARKNFNEKGEWVQDGYVNGNKVAYNKALSDEQRAELDHIVAAKEIHDDPGRVLAGLNGSDLANNEDNLIFTNMKLNNNMRNKSVEEYIQWCEKNPDQVNYKGKRGEPLPEDVKEKLRKEYNEAKAKYEAKLAKAYYTSPKFLKDTATAAGRRGVEMGVRQVMGFVFVEIWIATKEELQTVPSHKDLKDMLNAVADGIKKGVQRAEEQHKKIIEKFGEGFTAGALSSLTTTLCNIFFTTAKNLIKSIRQIYASVVEAGKILLFNPDDLMLGERIKMATVVLATGASVMVGTAVGELIGVTPIGEIPGVGAIVKTFCSTLVSGLMSCTLLVFLDRSQFMNALIKGLNYIPTEVNNYREIADMFEALAAKYADLDIGKFKKETAQYEKIARTIDAAENEKEVEQILLKAYKLFDIRIPWTGDFDDFMSDRSNRLVFE